MYHTYLYIERGVERGVIEHIIEITYDIFLYLSYLSLRREVYPILYHSFLYIERYIICYFNDILSHLSLHKEVYSTLGNFRRKRVDASCE